jgi:hypothetical protein
MEITNEGSPDWTQAEVYINGTPPFTYSLTVAAPKVGESVQLRLNDFVKSGGERFNPYTTALTSVWVGGGGYDFEAYTAR